MQIRIGKKFGFVAALVVAVFASQSASAEDLNGKDKTLSGKAIACSTAFSNSSDTLSTLTFEPDGTSRHYQGAISGNIKLVIENAGQTGAVLLQNQASHTHTGGTIIRNYVQFSNKSRTYKFGSQPAVVEVKSSVGKNAGIGFGTTGQTLTSKVILQGTGTENPGYQTTQANLFVRNAAGTGNFNGNIDVENCAGISLHHGGQCTYEQGKQMNFAGVINAAGADVYLTPVTNSVVNFNNTFTAKRLLCAYYTAAASLGRINLAAGKSFTFDAIELAGHFVNVNGSLNEGCILAFTPTSDGDVDKAVYRAQYASKGTPYCKDEETSKFTFGADQTINCVTGVALTATQAVQPGMVLSGSGRMLTLKCALENAECSAKVSGSLGLTLNAVDKTYRQTFLSRVNDTTGAINVQKGVFKIGAGASFPNVTDVTIGAEGTLEVATDVETPISASTTLALTTGAKIDIAEGATVVVDSVRLDDVPASKDDLVKANVLFGAGTFTVVHEPSSYMDGTWTSQTSGNWSETSNWENGKVAAGAAATATFRTAGTAEDPIVVTVDAAQAVGTISAEAGHVRLAGANPLQLGGEGLSGSLTVGAADASFGVTGSIVAGSDPLEFNAVSGSEKETVGKILWAPTSFAGAAGVSPRLSFGFGLLEIGSFGFLQNAADLTVGGGTVAYTGAADATIPGFTVGVTDGHAAIFSVTNAEATVTVADGIATSSEVAATDAHGFIKEGDGKLKILGDSTFNGKNSGYVAANIGVKANGTGPTAGYYSLNVADGTLEIGDADNAPAVTTANGMAVGLRSRPADQVQTGGSLVMSNGTLTVNANSMLIGYYSGVYHNGAGTKVTNRFTMAGGLVDIKAGSLHLGYDNAMNDDDLNSYADIIFNVKGGEVRAKQHLNVGNNKMGLKGTRIWMTMAGGLVHLDGDFVAGYANNCSRFNFTGNGGRLETRSVELNKAAGAATVNSRQIYEFNSGFTLQTPTITSTKDQIDVTFNGGAWEQTLADAIFSVNTEKYQPKLSEKGLVVALTNDAAKTYSLAILNPFVNDGSKKGTMTFQGPGFAKFGGDFASSTFTGAFTVKDGATVLSGADHLQNLNVVVAPGGALRTAEEREVMTASLTLGVAGATEPACIQMMTNASIKVAGDLKVLSPVVFTLAAGKEPNAALSGATVFDGFTIEAQTMSAYDRSLLKLDPADREAGYGLHVRKTETEDGIKLAVSVAKRGGSMLIIK